METDRLQITIDGCALSRVHTGWYSATVDRLVTVPQALDKAKVPG